LTFLRQERRASVEEKAAACFQIIPDRSEAAEGSGTGEEDAVHNVKLVHVPNHADNIGSGR